MSATTSKDPTAPALPDASRLPNAPYHAVLTGQPAIVTGANSGIGKAVALGLARAGADVAHTLVSNKVVLSGDKDFHVWERIVRGYVSTLHIIRTGTMIETLPVQHHHHLLVY